MNNRAWRASREIQSHADDWLMTYADVITLLLCCLALFASVSIVRKEVRHPVQAMQTAALPPAPLPAEPPRQTAPRQIASEAAAKPAAPPATAGTAPAPKPEHPPRTGAAPAAPPASAAPSPARTLTAAEATPAVSQPVTLELPRPDIPAGDRISTLEMSSAAFFDSGSAVLSKGGEAILSGLTAQLESDRLRGYRITIEGHTDDNPIHTAQFPSNWELSTARAAAVVHYFLDQGIPAQRLRAAGYADTFPKLPNRDADGNPIPQNQTQNRRVVIRLEKIEKDEPATVTASFFPPAGLQ